MNKKKTKKKDYPWRQPRFVSEWFDSNERPGRAFDLLFRCQAIQLNDWDFFLLSAERIASSSASLSFTSPSPSLSLSFLLSTRTSYFSQSSILNIDDEENDWRAFAYELTCHRREKSYSREQKCSQVLFSCSCALCKSDALTRMVCAKWTVIFCEYRCPRRQWSNHSVQ